MGNDIVAHTIVIGLFYHKIGMACCRKVKLIVSFNLYDILHWLILYVHALCRTALPGSDLHTLLSHLTCFSSAYCYYMAMLK